MLLLKQIKRFYIKIVNKLNDKHTLCFTIFFCLGLLYIVITKKDINIILNAAPVVAAGAKAATAAKTASAGAKAASAAKNTSAGANALQGANAGTQGSKMAAQGIPGQPNNKLPNKNVDGNTLKKSLGEKTPKLDDSVKQKSAPMDEATKEKKKPKIGGGNEEVDEEEESSVDEGSTELLGKKKNNILKIILICLPILFFFLIALMPFIMVASAASVIEGVFNNINIFNKGSELNEISEKSNELVVFDSFVIDDKRVEENIVAEYNKYYGQYGAEINIPLLVTTLFYDVYSEENDDENVRIAKMDARVNAISELSEKMLSIKENEFLCVENNDEEGNKTYGPKFVKSVFVEKADKQTFECDEKNVGEKVYSYSREIDYDGYYKYLLESNVLKRIYSNNFFEEGTEEEKQIVIDNINSSYSMMNDLYFEGKIEICEEKNRIPYNVLNNLKSPLEGLYVISSYFGPRPSIGDFHKGIDAFYIDGGDDYVYSVGLVPGTVVDVGRSYFGGEYVKIKYVIDGEEYYTFYCHLKEGSITVEIDQELNERQVIAKVGNTGMMPGGKTQVGKHLHFHISKGDSDDIKDFYNPVDLYMNAANYTDPCGGK